MVLMVASSAGGGIVMTSEEVAAPAAGFEQGTAVEAGGWRNSRYFQQPDVRTLRDRYLPRLKHAIVSAYKIGPVTADDLVVLESCLRTYVSDEHLRRELFEAAEPPPTTGTLPDPSGISRYGISTHYPHLVLSSTAP